MELTRPDQSPHVVRMKPGRPLTFIFDSRLGTNILLAERKRFERVDTSKASLLLLPSRSLQVGQKLRLWVPFQGEQAPVAAELMLEVVDKGEDTLVRVYRNGSKAVSMDVELEQERQLRQELEAENARLRDSLQSLPKGLSAVAAAKVADGKGVRVRDIRRPLSLGEGSRLALGQDAYSYQTMSSMAVKVQLRKPSGVATPRIKSALLRDSNGTVLMVPTVWQGDDPEVDDGFDVIIEAELPPVEAQGPWTLELEVAGGMRRVIVKGIVFPGPPD